MIVEGQGRQVPPAPASYRLTACDIEQAAYATRQNAAKYKDRADAWGAGIVQTPLVFHGHALAPSERAYFIGVLGELASYHLINRRLTGIDSMPVASLDWSKRAQGDFGVDIRVLGRRLQVKTRQREADRVCVKQSRQYEATDFVFCEWTGGEDVSVLGWLPTRHVTSIALTRSARGSWQNHDVYDSALRPLQGLITELRIEGDKRRWQ